ncbi:MAG: tetratricopeptide repeat protein [Nitrospiraceae bacterium]
MMWRFLFAVLLVVACATVAAAGPIEDAVSAYYRGDYTLAAQLSRPLAEQGQAEAQFILGGLYANGLGVLQNDQEAVKWYHKAAGQGHALAQVLIGTFYANGEGGVPQDLVRAHMWLNVAAAALSGDVRKKATKNRESMASRMTAAQIEKAQAMARRCRQSKYKECG